MVKGESMLKESETGGETSGAVTRPQRLGVRIGVVGGGILGMAVAEKLSQQGYKVTLYEEQKDLGGLAGAWRIGDVQWDRHYHVILLSDFNTRALLDRLGLEKETRWVETKTGFYTDGKFYSMSNSLEFLRFPPLDLISKLRLGATIFYTSKIRDWKRLERIPVGEYLQRLSGDKTFTKIWLPLLRAKLGDNHPRTSAAFIWATIARMYIARQSGLKKEMFGYVPGGYARILERFTAHLEKQGVRLFTDNPVEKIEAQPGGTVGITTGKGTDILDKVVVTVPAPIASDICVGLTDSEQEKLNRLEYQGVICASILLRRPLSPYYITNITDSWVPFTAVIEMSALVDRGQFGGHSLVYLPWYVSSEDKAFEESDLSLRDRWLAALSRMYPFLKKEDVLGFRISRRRHVHALSTLNYSDHVLPMKTSMDGVHLVNSSQIVNGTTNVNETLALANRFFDSFQILNYSNENDTRTGKGLHSSYG